MATTPTDEEIAEVMERARVVACPPGGRNCMAFPSSQGQLAPDADGYVDVGWIHDPDTRADWHVLYHPATGAGRLRRWRTGAADG